MDFSGWNYFFCYKFNKMRHVKAHLPFFYHYTSLKYRRKKIVMYCNGFVLFLISFMSSKFEKSAVNCYHINDFETMMKLEKYITITFLKAMRKVWKIVSKFMEISRAKQCILSKLSLRVGLFVWISFIIVSDIELYSESKNLMIISSY